MQDKMSGAEGLSSANILVKGRVQGVYFRKFSVENARKLDLAGFAQNMPDGRVLVFAEGGRSSILKLIALLHKGPPMARVDDLEVAWSPFTGKYQDFSIRR
ncbi:MAG: acylphosphatase [Methanolobus sp.]|nr:acylphosphatase [Methanolobus sp.]